MVKKKNIFVEAGIKNCIYMILYVLSALALSLILIAGNDYLARMTDALLSGAVVEFSKFFMPLVFMIVCGVIMTFVRSICGNTYSVLVQLDVKKKLGHHLLELPYSYFDEKGTGSIMTKLLSDINDAGRFFSEILPDLIVDFVTVITITVYLLNTDIMLIVVLFITYPVLLVLADKLSKKLTKVVKKRKTSLDKRTQIAFDAISGMEVVRSYNLENVMQDKISYYVDDVANQGCASTKITSMGHVLRNTISTIPIIICYLFALGETISGKITTGDMLAFSVLLSRITWPLGNIVFCINDIREVNVSLKRIQEIQDQDAEKSGDGIFDINTANSVIEWKNVRFSYDNKNNVLNDISFTIKKGETIAFAGGSGEGKSTIFKLLCGFYRKTGGEYLLYGHAYDDWNLNAARECFSYVSQNVFLFPETIWENVAYGREGATREEVINACKNANIHDFIMNLPENYDTIVGERGVKLSGGERQRISIARAFLKNAPILLLDEPTAAVDAGTEHLLQEAIARILSGKTVIIIAHRLSTIKDADMIYVVEKGRIAECGRHQELLDNGKIYAAMYGKEVEVHDE